MNEQAICETIGHLVDSLTYNRAYFPDYPEEDRTSAGKEEAKAEVHFQRLLTSIKEGERHDWILWANREMKAAFKGLRNGDQLTASRAFETSIDYLTNAHRVKVPSIDFIADDDGELHQPPPTAT